MCKTPKNKVDFSMPRHRQKVTDLLKRLRFCNIIDIIARVCPTVCSVKLNVLVFALIFQQSQISDRFFLRRNFLQRRLRRLYHALLGQCLTMRLQTADFGKFAGVGRQGGNFYKFILLRKIRRAVCFKLVLQSLQALPELLFLQSFGLLQTENLFFQADKKRFLLQI